MPLIYKTCLKVNFNKNTVDQLLFATSLFCDLPEMNLFRGD